MQNECLSEELLDFWKEKKVLVLDELIEQKQCSVTTIRRHLKKSNALSSLNHNSKYYTLPCYAQFYSNGLWFYNGILFSKHGSLLNTIIHLVETSEKGLSAKEIFDLFNLSTYSFLNKLIKKSKLTRIKYNGSYIYFSSNKNVKENQEINRQFSTTKITDEIGIIILTIFIKNPEINIEELQDKLSQQAIHLNLESLNEFFEIHQLKKKT
jgi:predicted transcriptional regulator